MRGRTLVVVNPKSRGGATERRWPAVESKLRDALGPLDVEFTRGPRDAERIAREGVRAGAELVVVAGGDGTASEAAAGLLGAGLAGYAELALLPLGTGGDFARGLGLRGGVDEAIERIARGKTRRIDAARAEFRGHDGEPARTWFLNISSIGISGLVTELVNRTTKVFGGRASFFLGTVRAIVRWRAEPVTLRVDGAVVHDGPLDLATVANGPYFGGGMHVAPDARHGDGLLDVVVVRGASKRRLLGRFPSLYSGRHVELDEVSVHRGTRVEADSPSRVFIEIDGEPLGTLPARYEVVPGALVLRGVDA